MELSESELLQFYCGYFGRHNIDILTTRKCQVPRYFFHFPRLNLNFLDMFCTTALPCKWISTSLPHHLIKSLTLHWVSHTPLFHPLHSSILSKYGMESQQSQQDSPGFEKQNLKEIADIWYSCFTQMPKFKKSGKFLLQLLQYYKKSKLIQWGQVSLSIQEFVCTLFINVVMDKDRPVHCCQDLHNNLTFWKYENEICDRIIPSFVAITS